MDLIPYIYNCCYNKQEFIRLFHDALLAHYPGLRLRWVNIYGKRWSHLYGDYDIVAIRPLKVQLNNNYGICIDNPEIIGRRNLEEIIAILKEFFRYAAKN